MGSEPGSRPGADWGDEPMLPFFKKKNTQPQEDLARGHNKLYVLTVRGRREMAWLEDDRWKPQIDTIVAAEAEAPMVKVHYGTYGSDGLRRDGPPGGAYSAVFDRYRNRGVDVYTRCLLYNLTLPTTPYV
jgi:hypothetical protein